MNKVIAGFLIAAAASILGFVIHVVSAEWISQWVTSIMQGKEVTASWDVRYVAAITSLETGVALVVLYTLLRSVLPGKSSTLRGLVLGLLLLALMGRLFRQPLMNLLIGNPVSVVVVQDGIVWIIYIFMSILVAQGCDRFLGPRDLTRRSSGPQRGR